jgi:hypothetical protein
MKKNKKPNALERKLLESIRKDHCLQPPFPSSRIISSIKSETHNTPTTILPRIAIMGQGAMAIRSYPLPFSAAHIIVIDLPISRTGHERRNIEEL